MRSREPGAAFTTPEATTAMTIGMVDVAFLAANARGVPFLFVTGYADTSVMTNVGHQVLRKPFEERELAERVAHVLGSNASPQGA